MNFIKFYVFGGILIGFLQTVDAILLILDKGLPRNFNLGVAMFEFLWVPICISTLVVFKRQNINVLSPVSYILYNLVGWTVATTLAAASEGQPFEVPLGFAIAGLLFGIYYTYINYRLINKN